MYANARRTYAKLIVRRITENKKTYTSENIRAMKQNITDTERSSGGGAAARVKGGSRLRQWLDVVVSIVRRHRARRWTTGGSARPPNHPPPPLQRLADRQAYRACGGNHDREQLTGQRCRSVVRRQSPQYHCCRRARTGSRHLAGNRDCVWWQLLSRY